LTGYAGGMDIVIILAMLIAFALGFAVGNRLTERELTEALGGRSAVNPQRAKEDSVHSG
jgi:hypothetical protein